jgi:hypothetical protein
MRIGSTLRLAALLALAAAAAPATADARRAPGTREQIVAAARRQVGAPFAGDCSAFVLSVLDAAGVQVELPPARSRSESIFLASRKVELPRPGDLAFFHDTYDRNRDGAANDAFTHVALVERVKGDRVLLLHRGRHRVERVRMDLARPSDRQRNDPVRWPAARGASGAPVLAGELFAGYGTVLPR